MCEISHYEKRLINHQVKFSLLLFTILFILASLKNNHSLSSPHFLNEGIDIYLQKKESAYVIWISFFNSMIGKYQEAKCSPSWCTTMIAQCTKYLYEYTIVYQMDDIIPFAIQTQLWSSSWYSHKLHVLCSLMHLEHKLADVNKGDLVQLQVSFHYWKIQLNVLNRLCLYLVSISR